ncbi:MAG: response regulator transcription factor [Planctomycetota bacterium]|jgi:two-component system response regulator DevR
MDKKAKKRKTKKKTKILIVDDDSIERRALTELINQESGFRVSAEAENANQALAAVDEQQVDLAIIDVSVENKNGIQLTKEIKSRCPNLPVLVLPTSEFLEK